MSYSISSSSRPLPSIDFLRPTETRRHALLQRGREHLVSFLKATINTFLTVTRYSSHVNLFPPDPASFLLGKLRSKSNKEELSSPRTYDTIPDCPPNASPRQSRARATSTSYSNIPLTRSSCSPPPPPAPAPVAEHPTPSQPLPETDPQSVSNPRGTHSPSSADTSRDFSR